MMRQLRLLLAVLLATAAGCAMEPEATKVPPTVQDSAGIRVVQNHTPQWERGDVWRVRSRPSLELGELDGPPEVTFGTIRAVGWLADGRIFVGDEQAHTIRIFSPDGDYLASVGREGEGPGELQWFMRVVPYRVDSLFVHDYALEAISVFGPDLSYARRFAKPVTRGNYWVTHAFTDGRFLLFSPGHTRFEAGPGPRPDTSLILVAHPNGETVDTVGAFEIKQVWLGPNGREEPSFLNAYGAIAAAGRHIVWTEGKRFEVVRADILGDIEWVARIPHSPVAVTEQVKSDFRQAYREWLGVGVEGGPERLERNLSEGHYADHLPATAPEIRIDATGAIWVGRYGYPGTPTNQWEIFDRDGIWLGSVETPEGLTVHMISESALIGTAEGEYDVPLVRVHSLDRR